MKIKYALIITFLFSNLNHNDNDVIDVFIGEMRNEFDKRKINQWSSELFSIAHWILICVIVTLLCF